MTPGGNLAASVDHWDFLTTDCEALQTATLSLFSLGTIVVIQH